MVGFDIVVVLTIIVHVVLFTCGRRVGAICTRWARLGVVLGELAVGVDSDNLVQVQLDGLQFGHCVSLGRSGLPFAGAGCFWVFAKLGPEGSSRESIRDSVAEMRPR